MEGWESLESMKKTAWFRLFQLVEKPLTNRRSRPF